jgi:hypothetical protein
MSEMKTTPTSASITDFLAAIPDERKRNDSQTIVGWMTEATGAQPVLWGPSIIGFGHTHYKYESGREGDWFEIGFSPRKANITLYLKSGYARYAELIAKLGKHKTGGSCLYINRLSDIDPAVLKEMITEAAVYARNNP